MSRKRFVSDSATATAVLIVDAVRHLLRPEEQEEFFGIVREAILAGHEWIDANTQREADRMRPFPMN